MPKAIGDEPVEGDPEEEEEEAAPAVELSASSIEAIIAGIVAVLDARDEPEAEEEEVEAEAVKGETEDEFDAYAEAVSAAEAALEEAKI